nr:serine/threonine protein kinase [Succinivibrionaceae bacterium]
ERTKQAVRSIQERLERSGLEGSVQFGLVSYRSNTERVPGLEYNAKVFVRPGEALGAKEFAARVESLGQAKVSSARFDEDAYSGISAALKSVDWERYGGRYMVLITDAGAIEGSSDLSTTGLDAKELRVEAEHHRVAIYALHLLTKAGAANHDKAKGQYSDLSFNQFLGKSLYYPVNAGDLKVFGRRVDELAGAIAAQVSMAFEGRPAAGAALERAKAAPQEERGMVEDTLRLGHAMQLAYLGSVGGTRSPSFFRGWIADRDLASHNQQTATPVVLLTKSELSDLKDLVGKVVAAAGRGMLAPDEMFGQLRSVAAGLGRDPATLKESRTLKISEMGLMDEYLSDLPYRSQIQDLDEETWSALGAEEQNTLVSDLEAKLRYYQNINDDADRWISLAEGSDPSEAVYPVPLEILP